MKKVLCMLLTAILALSCVSALADDTIKIGGIAPLTGAVSVYGNLVKNGVDLYVDEVNANGGVLGKQVEMIWKDDTGDAVEATNAYEQLVSEGVVAVIGPVTTTPTLAVSQRAYNDFMPMITASATAFAVTGELGDTKDQPYGNVFRACFLDPYQAELMAEYAMDFAPEGGSTKVAVLYDNTNDYSIGLYESFVKKAEELGMEVVAAESNKEGDADYTPQLTKIADAEPDVLFCTYYYETAAKVLRQAADVGLECWVFGADGFSAIADQVQDDTSLLDHVAFCDSYSDEDTAEIVQAFVKSFTDKYGEAPVGFNALGYDAAKVILTAIETAGTTEGHAVCDAMKATSLDCVTGHITFDEHCDPIKSAYIKGFVDGVPTLLKRIDP